MPLAEEQEKWQMQSKIKAGSKFIPSVGSTTWSVEQKSGKAVTVRCLDQR